MQPPRPRWKADNCRLIPSSQFATRQTHERFSRHANCLMTSSPAGEKKELVCHECPALSRKLLAGDGSPWGSGHVLLRTRGCGTYRGVGPPLNGGTSRRITGADLSQV